jgi:hypothetical protein
MKNQEPAFPSTHVPNEGHFEPGISARDYFAAKAMQSIIRTEIMYQGPERISNDLKDAAKVAYECADAMMAEREKAKEGDATDREWDALNNPQKR